MSTYTSIVEHAQPLAYYNFNEFSGNLIDGVNALDFIDNSKIQYQQTGALLGEIDNKAIALYGILETPNTLDTTLFGAEFSIEFFINPTSIYDTTKKAIIQRGTILQASDATAVDQYGKSLSLSDSGTVLVVGAYGHETTGLDTGAVYTYDLVDNLWVQRGSLLQASDAADSDYFGISCSLSNDGEVLVVGANYHETAGNATGAVYTYDRSGSTWVQRGSILQSDELSNYQLFGDSCALSNDGNVLVVGAEGYETNLTDAGGLFTYDRSGSTWVKRGSVLEAGDKTTGGLFGLGCSLSSDGEILVVSTQFHDSISTDSGAVYTYDRSGSTWVQRGLALKASDIAVDDYFGASCSLNNSGNILIVGASGHEHTGTDTGIVFIYEVSGSTWIQRGILQASDYTDGDFFGSACSLNGVGDVLMIGAIGHSTTGAAYTYDYDYKLNEFAGFKLNIGDNFWISATENNELALISNDTWNQRGSILQASDKTDSDQFGISGSLSNDGNILVVGASRHETTGTDTGAVYTYDRSGSTWIQRGAVLQASDLANSDFFGFSCSLNDVGNILIVGAYTHETTGINTGAVYTYDRSGDSWVQRGSILQASDITDNDYFGVSCSLNATGDVLSVGASRYETTGINTGAVYTYDRSGDSWVQRGAVLQASDKTDNDQFGFSCSLNATGDVLIVGAYLYETTGTNTGAVYTYDRSGSTWNQRGSILQASDKTDNDYFGISCSLNATGDVLVVGASAHETTGTDTGAVYTYDRSGSTWIQRGSILQASDKTDNDYFGFSCSLNDVGNILIVGAYSHETTGTDTGAVYTYDIDAIENTLTKDKYNHIILNYKNNQVKIYNNSRLINSQDINYSFDATSYIRIQGNPYIDELSVYDKTLCEYEIQSRYNNSRAFDLVESNILDSNPMVYFNMDDTNDDMYPIIGYEQGEYFNNPTYSNDGKHGKSVLFDGVDQYAKIGEHGDPYYDNGDPYYDNVSLLMHMNGQVGSTTFTDDSSNGKVISVFGNTHISETQFKFNQSAYFDGTGDYLTTPRVLDSNTWTVEAWVYQTVNQKSILVEQYLGIDPNRFQLKSIGDAGNYIEMFSAPNGSSNGTTQITLNTWEHIAFSSDNGIVKGFLNGNLEFTSVDIGVPPNLEFKIGVQIVTATPDALFNGYIDELRVTKDIARYSKNFTPFNKEFYNYKPPLNSWDFGTNVDLFYDQVALLLHMDGTVGSNTFIDDSKLNHGVSTNGLPTISETQFKFNQSCYFDGLDDYLIIQDHPDLKFQEDFTIEAWIYLESYDSINSSINYIVTKRIGTLSFEFMVAWTGHKLTFAIWNNGNTYDFINGNTVIELNTWYHVAVSHKDELFTLYVNGINDGELLNNTPVELSNSTVIIGAGGNNERLWHGYIDDLRITNTARYTGNFNVPANPYSHVNTDNIIYNREFEDKYYDNVILLMHMDGEDGSTEFIDDSKHNISITPYNNAKISKYKYKLKSSASFDGTGDYIFSNVGTGFLTSNDFTIEFHVNISELKTHTILIISDPIGNNRKLHINFATNSIGAYMDFGGDGISIPTTVTNLNLNTWYHIAVTRQLDTFYLFIDGINSGELVDNRPLDATSTNIYIGRVPWYTPYDLNGYVDELRITDGIARYTADFIPPEKSFYSPNTFHGKTIKDVFNLTDNISTTPTDDYWDTVSLLMHMDGVVNSNAFYDESSVNNSITVVGNTHISETESKFNQSAKFDGTGDYMEVQPNSAFDFGTGDFTIELYTYIASNSPTYGHFFSIAKQSDFTLKYWNGTSQIYALIDNATRISTIVTFDTWMHVALVRESGQLKIFIDGVLASEVTYTPAIGSSTEKSYIGTSVSDTGTIGVGGFEFMGGYIDELRITKGLARYSSNFTPETNEFLIGTTLLYNVDTLNDIYFDKVSLLMHMNGYNGSKQFLDHSKFPNNINVFGNSYISTSQAKFNQSAKFDGVGDYLSVDYNSNLGLGSSIFTLEFWIYRTGDHQQFARYFTTKGGDVYPGIYIVSSGLTSSTDIVVSLSSNGTSFDIGDITLSNNVELNTWYHIAVVKTGTEYLGFFDGVLAGSITSSLELFNDGANYEIGGQSGTARTINGHVDELRITDGVARYTENFKPASLEFAHKFETLAISQECWFQAVSVTGGSYNTIFSKGNSKQNSVVIKDSAFDTTGEIYYYYNEENRLEFTTSLGLNTWNYIVVTQTNYETRMYLNGVQVAHIIDEGFVSGNDKSFYIANDDINEYPSNVLIDGYLLSDKILTADEIEYRYNSYQGINSNDDYYKVITTQSPVRYYKLNDIDRLVTDEITGKYGVFNSNAIFTSKQTSLILADPTNKAVYFDNSLLSLDSDITGIAEATISLIFKFDELPTGSNLYITGGGGATFIYYSIANGNIEAWSSAGGISSSGFSPVIDTTYYLTVTYTASNIEWFIDGVSIGSASFTTGIAEPSYLQGKKVTYDEFLIYDRILTPQEISDLYTTGLDSMYKRSSYEKLALLSTPNHYYKLNELTPTIVDTISGYNGVVSGNDYTLNQAGLLLSDVSNDSINLVDGVITFDNSITFGAINTISFIMTLNSQTPANIISQTGNGGFIIDTDGYLKFDNTTNVGGAYFKPEIGKSYHYILNIDATQNTITCYVNGVFEFTDNIGFTMTGFDTIGGAGSDINIDEVIIYDDTRLRDYEISQLYSRATFSVDNSIGWRITGITQVAGINKSVDVRLYHHDTGALITQIKSNDTGRYEIAGLLEGVYYDIATWEESEITTCQNMSMRVLPEQYAY